MTALRETDHYISGQELCDHLGVSRTAVWKAVKQLEKEGYEIEAVQNRGYRLQNVPDRLSENEINSICKTNWMGKKVYYYDTIDSTNTEAKRLAEEGAPNGSLVLANEQTTGRGRRGRSFTSESGTGIFMTFLLKPDIAPGNASMLTLVTAMAVAKGIQVATGEACGIKWPNDIIIDGKKVCGILTEMSAQIECVNYVVVGIGINVQNESFDEEIAKVATSLYMETGKRFNRAQIVEAVMEQFEFYYDQFMETQDLSSMVKEYNSYLVNMNQKVQVIDPKEPYQGTARGINKKGELIVDTWEARKLVSSGEVSVRGVYGYV